MQLYLDGKMERSWPQDKEEGVILLMDVESVGAAVGLLKPLPLGQDHMLTIEPMPGLRGAYTAVSTTHRRANAR